MSTTHEIAQICICITYQLCEQNMAVSPVSPQYHRTVVDTGRGIDAKQYRFLINVSKIVIIIMILVLLFIVNIELIQNK